MNNQPNSKATPVLFAETGRQLLARGDGMTGGGRLEVVVGADPTGAAVTIDLRGGPVLVTGPTGSGRTTTARLLAAQALRAGAACSIVDHRRGHARWVNDSADLREVDLWQSPGETREGLAGLARFCEQRHALADRYQTDQPGGDNLHVLVVEDLHHLARILGSPDPEATRSRGGHTRARGGLLRRWPLWPHRRLRRVQPLDQVLAPMLGYPERTPGRRSGSRAARAFDELISGGRAAGLAIIATTGPGRGSLRPELVEQFATRIAHHTGPSWGRGRVEVTDPSGATRPAQVIYMSGPEANAWAAGGHAEVASGNSIGCPACGEPFEPDPWAPTDRCPTCAPAEGATA